MLTIIINCATFPRNEPTNESNRLTVGNVKKEIIKGKTNQAEVLSFFGSPNLVTMNSKGEEVWNFSRMSYTTSVGSDAGSILLWSGSRAMSSTTTRSFDLIITFDKDNVVKDFNVISASY